MKQYYLNSTKFATSIPFSIAVQRHSSCNLNNRKELSEKPRSTLLATYSTFELRNSLAKKRPTLFFHKAHNRFLWKDLFTIIDIHIEYLLYFLILINKRLGIVYINITKKRKKENIAIHLQKYTIQMSL